MSCYANLYNTNEKSLLFSVFPYIFILLLLKYIIEVIKMSRIILCTGGVRSGKSRFAASVMQNAKDVVYIATMEAADDEMNERVLQHKIARPACWVTEDQPLCPLKATGKDKHYILDCITMLTSNIMFKVLGDGEIVSLQMQEEIITHVLTELEALINMVKSIDGTLVMVTNETGYSVVPDNHFARVFRDILGTVNRETAVLCDEVYLSVCGLQMKLKG
jgi:adenosylcobinamide kinase/adenosylcobinamide-phosphate guanylyltransferase